MIRAQCNQTGDILELIPSRILQEDLPPALVNDHVHWLNLSTKIIEIRPLPQLWEESSENWRIDCASGQYRMYKGREALVDIRSPTWEMVSKCFQCLNGAVDNLDMENTQHNDLLITMSSINSPRSAQVPRLSVTLPRYSLSFYVNEWGELESRDFKDMVYDENQCIGALFGSENLLVLRQRTHLVQELMPRRVLTPNGPPGEHGVDSFRNDPSAPPDHPLYHTYDVDTEMGCLVGNGTPTSVKYLAGLHAMTSYHRPDPLTGKTGAQAALCLSQSAGCRSFMKLDAFDNAHHGGLGNPHSNHGAYVHPDVNALDKRAARRAAYRFPWNASGPTAPDDYDDLNCSTPEESDLELEDVVSTAASAIHRWSFDAPTMNTILTHWAKLWNGNEVRVVWCFLALTV